MNFDPETSVEIDEFDPSSAEEVKKSAWSNIKDTAKDISSDIFNKETGTTSSLLRSVEQAAPALQSARMAIPIAEAYGQVSESPLANVALSALENKEKAMTGAAIGGLQGFIGQFGEEALKGVTGEKRGEYGDVYQRLGIPKPAASTFGLATSIVMDPTGIKPIVSAGVMKSIHVLATKPSLLKKTVGEIEKFAQSKLGEDFKLQTKLFGTDYEKTANQVVNDIADAVKEKWGSRIQAVADNLQSVAPKNKEKFIKNEMEQVKKLEADKLILDEQLGRMGSERNPVVVKSKIDNFFRRNSSIYGKRLNDIADMYIEHPDATKRIDVNDAMAVIEKAKKSAEESFLTDDDTYKRLLQLENKYKNAQPATLKTFFNDFKNIRDKGKFDSTKKMFVQSWNDTMKSKSPEFALLQEQYEPIMKLKEKADSMFGLFNDAKLNSDSVEKFLKDSAEGNLTGDQLRWLDSIKKDNPGFSKGIDDLSANTKLIRMRRSQIDNEINSTKLKIDEKSALLDRMFKTGTLAQRASAAKEMALLRSERNNILKMIKERGRALIAIEKQGKGFQSTKNRVKNTLSSIVIYELATRPIRGMIYKMGVNN